MWVVNAFTAVLNKRSFIDAAYVKVSNLRAT